MQILGGVIMIEIVTEKHYSLIYSLFMEAKEANTNEKEGVSNSLHIWHCSSYNDDSD